MDIDKSIEKKTF